MLKVRKEASFESKHQSFSYQIETVEAAASLDYAAIFHEQGLGKTKIAIDLALKWIYLGALDSVIIVTKKGLIRNWEQEIEAHSYFKAKTLDQDSHTLFYAFNSPARLYLTHYEVFKSAQSAFALFLKTRRVGVICDESQKIKNPQSAISRSMHALSQGFRKRVIMSGTPIANRPYDIWSQIFFLDNGNALGKDFESFKRQLDLPDGGFPESDFEQELAAVFDKIKAFTIRKTKASSGIVLPTKELKNVSCDFAPKQRQLYAKFQKELRAEIVRDGKVIVDDADAVLKRLLRLVQIASNPALVDEAYTETPGKVPMLKSIVHDAVSQNSKVIVWTSFTENADALAKSLAEYGSARVHGKMAISERNAAVQRFKDDKMCKVLVATPGAAKEGLTLTVANFAVFYDRTFSLDDYLQAQDRIHRISQSSTCYISNLLIADSIDDWIAELLSAKHIAAQLGQGDISRKEFEERMSYDFSRTLAKILNPETNNNE
jgi:SNF2 family DNA or RNA helicase